MTELVGRTIKRVWGYRCDDSEEPDMDLVVFEFEELPFLHRFFLDAGAAVWEELDHAEAVADFADCHEVAVPLAGARVLSAACDRSAHLDELTWRTSHGVLRMYFADRSDSESPSQLEYKAPTLGLTKSI